MRKPTVVQFFGAEVTIWIAIIIWLGPDEISAVNLSVAAFNMIGMFIGMATGWAPWREQEARQ